MPRGGIAGYIFWGIVRLFSTVVVPNFCFSNRIRTQFLMKKEGWALHPDPALPSPFIDQETTVQRSQGLVPGMRLSWNQKPVLRHNVSIALALRQYQHHNDILLLIWGASYHVTCPYTVPGPSTVLILSHNLNNSFLSLFCGWGQTRVGVRGWGGTGLKPPRISQPLPFSPAFYCQNQPPAAPIYFSTKLNASFLFTLIYTPGSRQRNANLLWNIKRTLKMHN